MKFTQGPYRIAQLKRSKLLCVKGGVPEKFIATVDGHYDFTDKEALANATLLGSSFEMYEALKLQHRAIDILMAKLITIDPTFRPTKSGSVWEACSKGHDVIKRVEGV